MSNIMTIDTSLASPADARLRVSTGAFAAAAVFGGQGGREICSTKGAVRPAHTPAIVDVVDVSDLPGVPAWSPQV
jgi:hypothetical protein